VRQLAALALVAGWLVPLAVPHGPGDDPICVVGLTGESTPGRVDAPAVSSGPEHCLVCHLARTFRSTLTGGDRVALWLVPGQLVPSSSNRSRRGPDVDRLAARAPPFSSFLL
jgi:hypothetical protein